MTAARLLAQLSKGRACASHPIPQIARIDQCLQNAIAAVFFTVFGVFAAAGFFAGMFTLRQYWGAVKARFGRQTTITGRSSQPTDSTE